MKEALTKVVVFRANSHDGKTGEALAKKYEARGLPHFVLVDASGATLDRWSGYRGAEDWLRNFRGAIADLTTVEAKEQTFKSAPTERLAAALGRIYASRGFSKDSVGYYREAQRLAGGSKPEYVADIFFQQLRGLSTNEFKMEDVRASADAVMATEGGDPTDTLLVAGAMSDLAADKQDPAIFAPYLDPALKVSAPLTDAYAKRLRTDIEIAGALFVKGDKNLAVTLKKSSMPAGWEQNAGDLNEFAWWCFEHRLDLEEAERLARKGVDLAKPGAEKAEALDTAAEICNLMGDGDEAVSLAEQAAKEDPRQEHYAKQVKKFAEIRDKKKAEAGA